MNKTKIEWCDSTWNPVTGCLHGCEYCYARKMAHRFGRPDTNGILDPKSCGKLHEIDKPIINERTGKIIPYPYEFSPTLHKYRLDEPQKCKKPRTIFVCSMADLFGNWVSDKWIEAIFEACEKAPQHRYLFLTKNPKRLCELANNNKLPKSKNYWFGSTVTNKNSLRYQEMIYDNTFLSIEPLLEPLDVGFGSFGLANWIIIGAETGNRKDKIVPQKEWIEHIVEYSDKNGIPVFMKDSLIPIVGEENMRRDFPW